MEQLQTEQRENAALRLEIFQEMKDGRLDDLHLDLEGQDAALAFVNDGVHACRLHAKCASMLIFCSCHHLQFGKRSRFVSKTGRRHDTRAQRPQVRPELASP